MSETSQELTADEVRERFLAHVRDTVLYWATLPDKTCAQRLNGVAFSILAVLDGASVELPGFIVAPAPHPSDRAYRTEHGEPYYPDNDPSCVNADIGGSLHEHWHDAPDGAEQPCLKCGHTEWVGPTWRRGWKLSHTIGHVPSFDVRDERLIYACARCGWERGEPTLDTPPSPPPAPVLPPITVITEGWRWWWPFSA